jgi:hypothetical protein
MPMRDQSPTQHRSGLTRRRLLLRAASASLVPLLAMDARAQGRLDPADPSAIALGYTTDHSRVDVKRWPKKAREDAKSPQRCSSCAMRNPEGGCQLFGGRKVSDNGWCNAWTAR